MFYKKNHGIYEQSKDIFKIHQVIFDTTHLELN